MPQAPHLFQPLPGMPAAIYARVSTPKQKEHGYSLDTQLPACLAYAKEYGFPVRDDHIFVDDETGKILDRHGMNHLRDLVHQQVVKLVIVYKIDRFMRDYTYQLMMIKEFGQYGVQVLDTTSPPLEPTPERILLQHILGAIAQFEHSIILERTEDGRRRRAEAGIPAATSPYGYRYVGIGKTGHYELDPDEAPVVLQIFQWYGLEELGLQPIAGRLNRAQVPTPWERRGRHGTSGPAPAFWRPSNVHHILTNRDYLGTQYYGKTTNIVGTNPRKKTRHQATDEATWVPIAIPALVPPSLFAAVQQRLTLNAVRSPRRRHRDYLLIGGRLKCEVCHKHMIGVPIDLAAGPTRAYRCYKRLTDERRKTCRRVYADVAEAQIWEEVCRLARHPEVLEDLMDTYSQRIGPAELAEARATLMQTVQQAQRALERLVDLYLHQEEDAPAPLPKALYLKKKKELDKDLALTQAQLTALNAQEQAQAAQTSQKADMEAVLHSIREVLDDATTIPEQQRILDMLNLQAFYTRDGHFRVRVEIKKSPVVDAVSASSASRHTGSRQRTVDTFTFTWTLAS